MDTNHGTPTIQPVLRQLLEAELNTGENIVWCQAPRWWSLVPETFPLFFFGIPFFFFPAFALYKLIFLEWHQITRGQLLLWLSFLGMFALVGLGLLLSPLWACWKAMRTVYAITDQRALIIAAPWRRTVRTYFPGVGLCEVVDLHRVEGNRGRGDIVFHQQAILRKRGVYYESVGFIGIDNVREVEGMVRRLLDKSCET